MNIQLITTDKKRFLPLLLLADEQESMITRYLERGELFVMHGTQETETVAVTVVTNEGNGVYELKNLAVAPACQRKGYGRRLSQPNNVARLRAGPRWQCLGSRRALPANNRLRH